jgi:hypothetical protein
LNKKVAFYVNLTISYRFFLFLHFGSASPFLLLPAVYYISKV